MVYDENNIFVKILCFEIFCMKVFEDDYVFVFEDINLQVLYYVLVILKGLYVMFDDFVVDGFVEEIVVWVRVIGKIVCECGLYDSGYCLFVNMGCDGYQEVLYLYVYFVGGCDFGGMI